MPYNSIEEIPMIDKKLQMLGIMPIYYKVANKGTSQDNPLFIHGELDKLITEIAEKRGIPTSQPSLDELNRRTLDLIQ
jgi:hypothetical protein